MKLKKFSESLLLFELRGKGEINKLKIISINQLIITTVRC